ncbi:hypothetical protein Tco_1070984 [Tanacetum coccineum]|uniref:Uncharacterized protein n=1 Tax=Tanacetum coccineum TaxID=301880 RepID=A0ABQ5HN13_9ASTR
MGRRRLDKDGNQSVPPQKVELSNKLDSFPLHRELLSGDFGTAWNSRKEAVVKTYSMTSYLDELRFSALVLSHSPKSECA